MASEPDMRGFVPNPSGRGTVDILLSCVSTLIICVWTSIHPNMLSPGRSERTPSNKYILAALMILLPELALALVIDDFLRAWRLRREIKTNYPGTLWTLTDAWFVLMDGFVYNGKSQASGDILHLMRHGDIDPLQSKALEIRDRSKADGLAKLLACTQISWLMIQCLARKIQHLPMSTLELGTVGYAFVAILIYSLQWHKPKDVRTHINLQPRACTKAEAPASSSVVALLGDISEDLGRRESYHPGNVDGLNIDSSSSFSESKTITFTVSFDEQNYGVFVGAMFVFCILFGGWHCFAWNFAFPSVAERWLWRIGSILSVTPGLLILVAIVIDELNSGWSLNDHTFYAFSITVMLMIYVAARATILVEMFISLRRMPAGVFETVQWTTFIPHF